MLRPLQEGKYLHLISRLFMNFNYICIWVKEKKHWGEKNWKHIEAINYLWLLEEAILITANWLSVGMGAAEGEEKDTFLHVSHLFIFSPSASFTL